MWETERDWTRKEGPQKSQGALQTISSEEIHDIGLKCGGGGGGGGGRTKICVLSCSNYSFGGNLYTMCWC